MEVYVDGDACPVRDIVYEEAHKRGIQVIMVISMNQEIMGGEGMDVVRVDSAFQAVDMAIINRVGPGDIVVTSDFGLASIALARGARAISFSGRVYSDKSIDSLLTTRYVKLRQRRGGARIKGPAARRREDNRFFRENFKRLLEGTL